MTGAEQPTQAEELRIVVELRDEVAERAAEELRDAVRAAVEELVTALGIPVEPSVTIESSANGSEERDPYRIRIGDRWCAYVPSVESSDAAEADVERLTEASAATIAANRELLLTPPIADRLVEGWKAQSSLVASAGLSPDMLASVLVDLTRRCISVAPRPLGDAAHESGGGQTRIDTRDGLLEAILDARNEASVTVFVEPELADPPDQSSISSEDYDLSVSRTSLQELSVDELGLVLPTVDFTGDPDLGGGRFRIRVNDLTFPPLRGLLPTEALVVAGVDDLAARGLALRTGTNPTTGAEAAVAVADDAARAALRADGFFVVEPRTYVVFAAHRALRRLAGSLLLSNVLMFQLNRLREDDAAVVDAALARFDRYLLTAVFRSLLDEQVPIRNAVGILEGMLAIGSSMSIDQSTYDVFAPDTASIWSVADGSLPAVPEAADYGECVRRHLRWHLTREVAGDDGRVQAFMIDRRLESRIRRSSPPLDADELSRLRRAVWSVYEPFARAGTGVVAVTNSEVRRELRRVLEPAFPELRVLSRHEIAPETEVRSNGEIAWA